MNEAEMLVFSDMILDTIRMQQVLNVIETPEPEDLLVDNEIIPMVENKPTGLMN